MDWDVRIKWAYPEGSGVVESDIVFMNEEHGLPFIPWVVIDYGDPLWESVINSGIWENVQYINLIMFAKALEQSTRSTLVFKTPDGTLQNVYIDYSNPSNPIVVPLDGTQVEDQQAPPIDPQLSMQFEKMMAMVSASTVSQVLTNIGQYSDAPFSTVERIVQMALGQLSPAKKAAEAAEAEGIYQGFQWIDHSKIPLVAYRTNTFSEKKKKGEQVAIWPGEEPAPEEVQGMSPEEKSLHDRKIYFDLEHLYISVRLQADNVADEQSRLNLLINAVDRMGMSKKDAWEKLGWKNYELSQSHRAEEIFSDAEIQNEVEAGSFTNRQRIRDEIMQEVQAEQEAAAAEQEKSLQNQQNEMNSGSQFTSLQGRDMRGGGQSASQVAPLETREQITGQTQQGQGMV